MSRRRPPRGAAGFTLIEMLVVLGIIAAVFAMVMSSFAHNDLRRQSVEAAAGELAATFKRTRALAMERKSTYAVVFHIQNDPASSGRVLNNRSGGHWYRVLGPSPDPAKSDIDSLPLLAANPYGPFTLAGAMRVMERSWVGDAHVLPARKVRFLALTDMDYGDYGTAGSGRVASASASFPRPWFGWYDAGAKRLYPWGGYDPAIAGSGFYFWGNANAGPNSGGYGVYADRDPQPLTCTNPVTRTLDGWTSQNLQDSLTRTPELPASDVLYTAGSPRPLINAAWRDVSLVFTSTGEVRWGNFLPARHCYEFNDNFTPSATPGARLSARRGVGERCNAQGASTTGAIGQHSQDEAGNFDESAGGWFITLAPDVADDRDTFNSAQEALDTLYPMCRVFVSSYGEVRVIRVSRTPRFPAGTQPFPPTPDWWRSPVGNVRRYFGRDRYVDASVLAADGATGVGRSPSSASGPITDFLTPEMLAGRQVWMK